MTPSPFRTLKSLLAGAEPPPRKQTVAEGESLFIGLNVYQTGEGQPLHSHAGEDKAYIVLRGEGIFTVGDVEEQCGAGDTIWAPSGIPHGVVNPGSDALVLLLVMAPPPSSRRG